MERARRLAAGREAAAGSARATLDNLSNAASRAEAASAAEAPSIAGEPSASNARSAGDVPSEALAEGRSLSGSGWLERSLADTAGPIVAASDYVRLVADSIRAYLPRDRRYVALGTDGFGRSDSRAQPRAFFEVDARAIAYAAVVALCDEGELPAESARVAAQRWAIDLEAPEPWSH